MKSNIHFNTLVFDLDGVIVDSEQMWNGSMIEVFKDKGVVLEKESLPQYAGVSLKDIVKIINAKFQQDFQYNLINRELREIARHKLTTLEAMPFVFETIQLARSLDMKVALCTSATQDFCQIILKNLGLNDTFDTITTSNEVIYTKPHPEPYIQTLGKISSNPLYSIAIEDSITGLLSAKSANLNVISLPPVALRLDKRYGMSDLIIHSLEELTSEKLFDFSKQMNIF